MKLFDFQKRGLEQTEKFDRCAYYWDMGLGKTFVGSEKLWSFGKRVNLIVCQKSKIDDWFEHILNLYGSRGAIVYDLSYKPHYELFLKVTRYPDDGNLKLIGIINYDLIYRRPELMKLSGFALMLDESQFIQNEKAKRSKFILKMNAANVILLSGTPVSGKYEQLYAQIQLLGWRISKTEFWNRYINYYLYQPVEGMPPIKIVSGYKRVDELKEKLAEYGAVFMKSEEAIDLPDQSFTTVTVESSSLYRKFIEDRLITVNDLTLVGDTTFNFLLYARQLCGAYSKEKLSAFKDLIDSTSSRVVVFYNFNVELDTLKGVIGDRPCSVVNGKEKNLSAYDEKDDAIILVQYQAGAMGLNLQKANHMIFFTPPLSSSHFEQAKKRIHRLGQTQKCFYYFLCCAGSVEEKIYRVLKTRGDYTNKLFEKDYETVSD